jgi:hypothetical protein
MTLETIAHAEQAVRALVDGDHVAAHQHLEAAQRSSRTTVRRERQVVEIAALVVAGAAGRATGLALIHTADFPDDAELLARITGSDRAG